MTSPKLRTAHFASLFLSLIALLFSNMGLAQTSTETDTAPEARIRQVENGLRPLVVDENTVFGNIESQMRKYKVQGLSMAVIDGYRVAWAKGYGSTGNPEAPQVDASTVFQVGSISKFVNAVAVLKLAEGGTIELDKEINAQLSSWKLPYDTEFGATAISPRLLLAHAAGLSTHGFGGYRNATKLPSLVEILDGRKPANSTKVRQVQTVGSTFRYSGGGTTILQLLVTDQVEPSYERFVAETVFDTLGMKASFFSVESEKYPKNRSFAHLHNGKPLKNDYQYYPESAAAGLWTTPTDLAKLIIDLQKSLERDQGTVLSQSTLTQMVSPPLEDSNAGLGLFVEKKGSDTYLQHSGANRGFTGQFYFSAENGKGVVIFLNSPNTQIIDEIIRSVASVYAWPGYEQLKVSSKQELQALDFSRFLGTYSFGKRRVTVSEKKGSLVLAEKGKWRTVLTPLTDTTFVANGIRPEATIEFVAGADGQIASCKIIQGQPTEWTKQQE
ncbi:serine hydrolase domain-containing protein [Flagellimonas sp. DF-77]|uniref:serine hydrolase domain-containing protein n=1 Tax=Flagellimonas algarum TaxID=3230298 RepID=UPI0033979A93